MKRIDAIFRSPLAVALVALACLFAGCHSGSVRYRDSKRTIYVRQRPHMPVHVHPGHHHGPWCVHP